MKIEYINPEKKLVSLVCAIGRDPLSWRGWKSLYINLDDTEEEARQDILVWSQSILAATLKDVDGEAFCSPSLGIHIIFKGLDPDIIHEIGEQIVGIAMEESGISIAHHLYDLQQNADEYIQMTLDKAGNNPVLIVDRDHHRQGASFEDKSNTHDRAIRNYHDYIKVLLVEDDPVTRWMVRNTLKKNCTFATADTAHKAYDMVRSFKPDIIFLDIGLPDESGKKVLEWILRNDPGACVVMFSSNDHLDNIANSLEDGATGFIPKPFLKEQLLHYIQAYEARNVNEFKTV